MQAKAGISNLIEIHSVATGEPIDAIERRYDGAGYGQFKEDVGEAVVALFGPIQERYRALRADETTLRSLLAQGAEQRARSLRADARGDVRAHGLRPPRLSRSG